MESHLFWSKFTLSYLRVNLSTTVEIKKAMLSTDKTLVDENNLEIPPNSIIHCLGSLFQVSDTGLRHIIGKKIDNDTYFADSDLNIQLNELAFVEQSDVTSTSDAAPRKEGLLASAYRFMTAPFLVRTPSNVTTRNKRKKSSPSKLVCIDNLASIEVTIIKQATILEKKVTRIAIIMVMTIQINKQITAIQYVR